MSPEAQKLYDKIRDVYLQPFKIPNAKADLIRAQMWIDSIQEALAFCADASDEDSKKVAEALRALRKDLRRELAGNRVDL